MKFEYEVPQILSQHVDTLVSTFRANTESDYLRYVTKILPPLDNFKEDAQMIEGFSNDSRYVNCEPFGYKYGSFRMSAQGSGAYRFILKNDDVTIFMSNAKFESDTPHIKVEFRAHYLFSVGQNRAYEYVLGLISQLLGTTFNSSIQRLDLATDVQGAKIEYLDSMRFQNSFKSTVHRKGSKLTGLTFGGGDFMFRVYDKLEEIKNNYSKHYVKTKWSLNGFSERDNAHVTRFEAQFRRAELKKYIPKDHPHEIDYVFNHLGNFWIKALSKIKYAPLTNEECLKLVDGDLKSGTKRQIFKRARDDEKRFQFQKFLSKWDNSISDHLIEYKDIKEPIIKTAERMLKGFIGSVYKAKDSNPDELVNLITSVNQNLVEYDGITLHDYAHAKVLDSFIVQEKMKRKYGVVVEFDYHEKAKTSFIELQRRLGDIKNFSMHLPHLGKTENIQDYFNQTQFQEVA